MLITQPSIHFRSTQNGLRYDSIWESLEAGAWKNILPENLLDSALIEGVDRSLYKPILKDFHLIHKGMVWDDIKKMPYDPIYIPKKVNANLDLFFEETYRFFNQYAGKQIGVQLSGGLDSSIIIGLLKYFKIPFYLVGLANKRFEFRTESRIQQILAEWADKTILVDYETCLPYSHIDKVPPHQYPEGYVTSFGPDYIMAQTAKNLGIEVLFTGQGGDNVFGDEILHKSPEELKWMPHTYYQGWIEDLVYAAEGIELVPFYANERFSELIYNLRLGQKKDIPKVWARQYFKDILPSELIEYSYCSDFWGFVISGVQEVIPKLPLLFEQTFNLTENKFFNKEKVKELIAIDLLDYKKETYMQIEPLLGIAVWIDSLVRGGIIKK
ncbi:MAG: hypothetical protein EBX50_12420 [Chitinophagia bacterium]|nr:hypothetical protein [Chitinophagia bacterium]